MKTVLRTPTLIGCTALATIALAVGAAAAGQGNHDRAQAAPHERCGQAITAAHHQVLGRETTLLGRCARALAEQQRPRVIEYRCSRLGKNGVGADRIERIARERIESHCSVASLPAWLPATCEARGPVRGAIVAQPTEAASCALSSGRCMALAAIADLFGDIGPVIQQEVPELFAFELGGVAGHTFDACTSPVSTTTTLPPPTTTTTTSTSTLPPPTTTSTTTLPEPTTTSTTLAQPPTTTTTSTTVPEPEAPSIVVTEIMTNPAAQSDTAGEYFEIENTGAAALELEGISFRDLGSNAFTVNTSVVVAPGARAVLGRSATAAGGAVDYIYGSAMSLGNSEDQILVEHNGIVLDEVAWDTAFPLVAGASMELAAAATDPVANDAASAWCASNSLLPDGDFGTPGAEPGGCLVLP